MLDLSIAMLSNFVRVLTVIFIGFAGYFHPLQIDQPRLDSPRPGETLHGVVTISGSTDIPGFASSEIAFGYADRETWFPILHGDSPATGPLGTWDTSTIHDGDYRLRLVVTLQDGTRLETVADDLHVQNETQALTAAPAAVVSTDLPAAENTPTPAPPTPTPLPANPAELDRSHLYTALTLGVILSVLSLIVFGIYSGLRSIARR
jgi:hypothetical protein